MAMGVRGAGVADSARLIPKACTAAAGAAYARAPAEVAAAVELDLANEE